MNIKHVIYLTLVILSLLNTLSKQDYIGSILSLLIIPMIFMLKSK